jgi:hypothetical protein
MKKLMYLSIIILSQLSQANEYSIKGVFVSPIKLSYNKQDFIGDKGFRTSLWKGKSAGFVSTFGSYCEFHADFDKIIDQRVINEETIIRLQESLMIENAKKAVIPVGASFELIEVENISHVYAQSKYIVNLNKIIIKNARKDENIPFEEIVLNGNFSFEAYCRKPPIVGWFYSLPSNFIEESFGDRIKINNSGRNLFKEKLTGSSSSESKKTSASAEPE